MVESVLVGLKELGEVTREMVFHFHCDALEKAYRDKQSLLGILQHFRGERCHVDMWIEEKPTDPSLASIKTLLFSTGNEDDESLDVVHAMVTILFTIDPEGNLLDCGSVSIEAVPPLMPILMGSEEIVASNHFAEMIDEIEFRKYEKGQ